jgi:hypothetical protein
MEHLRAAPLLGTHRLSTSLGQVVQPSVVVIAPFPLHHNNHTPELARRTRAIANYYKETDLRLTPSVRAAGPEPFFRKTGVTGPHGGLVPPPSIAHHTINTRAPHSRTRGFFSASDASTADAVIHPTLPRWSGMCATVSALINSTGVRMTTHFSILELIDCGFMLPLRGAHIRSTSPEPGYRHAWL